MSFLGNNTLISSINWSPKKLTNLALWLDADDINSFTFSIILGSPPTTYVAEWRDKSSNNRHLVQPNFSVRPIYNDSISNNKPGIVFDGVDDLLTCTSNLTGLLQNVSGYTAYMVFSPSLSRAGIPISISTGTNISSSRFYLYNNLSVNNRTFIIGARRLDTDNFTQKSTLSVFPANATTIYGSKLDLQNATLTHNVNGTAQNPVSFLTSGSTSNTAPLRCIVGCNSDLAASAFFSGFISEIIITNNNLTNTDSNKLEGYLAHKWLLSNSLPSNHPYKNSPP